MPQSAWWTQRLGSSDVALPIADALLIADAKSRIDFTPPAKQLGSFE